MPVIKRVTRGTGKKPRVKAENILLGMELEFTRPGYPQSNESQAANEQFQELVEDWADENGFDLDASHRDGGGVEVITQPYNFDWWKENGLKLFGFMNIIGPTNYKGDSHYAGIHVHIDRSIFVYEQFVQFVDFIRKNQRFMRTISRRGNRISFVNPDTHEGKTGSAFEDSPKLKEKYESKSSDIYGNNCLTLNNNGKGTIECRFFNGSNRPQDAMTALEFVRCVCYFIKSSREKTLLSFVGYVKEYTTKYPSLSKTMSDLSFFTPTGRVSEVNVSKYSGV